MRIPGYVGIENASVRFDVYNPVWPYLELGPEVYMPGLSPKRVVQSVERQTEGLLPGNAVVANANWWSVELSPYENEDGCWNVSFLHFFFPSSPLALTFFFFFFWRKKSMLICMLW